MRVIPPMPDKRRFKREQRAAALPPTVIRRQMAGFRADARAMRCALLRATGVILREFDASIIPRYADKHYTALRLRHARHVFFFLRHHDTISADTEITCCHNIRCSARYACWRVRK